MPDEEKSGLVNKSIEMGEKQVEARKIQVDLAEKQRRWYNTDMKKENTSSRKQSSWWDN